MINFIQRITSILYLAPLVLILFHVGGILLLAFLTVTALICIFEYNKMNNCELFGIIYITIGIYSFYFLRIHYGFYVTSLVLISVWSNDSLAYLFGKLFGKNYVLPKISPKKTREGFIAGSIGAILVPLIFKKYLIQTNMSDILFVGLSCIILAPAGDLIESKIKRSCKVKNSGNLIPGHGGVFDRIDSLLLIGPWTCLYFSIIKS